MTVTVEGEARNFESINAFYGNLQSRTRWFKKINYPGAKRSTTGEFEFTISFELQNAV
jgi:Tfp pilus assembly protein PilN